MLAVSACGGSGGNPANNDAGNTVKSGASVISDMEIAKAVYFDKRIPDGFYQEDMQDDTYYATSHIKNIDLLAIIDRAGIPVYELSSEDFEEAMTWSEQVAGFQTPYKQLVDNNETSLYYQFTRVDSTEPQFVNLHRVYKASVLDRNGVDEDYKGRITLTKLTIDDVKLIIEYLWTFTVNNNYGSAVLSSLTTETTDTFIHTMLQAKLIMSFNTGCDSIEVYEVKYTVSKTSGFIWKDEEMIREISTKRSGDNLEICEV